MSTPSNSLNNKNVLVTGADGFIGSHLVEMLVEQNCQVHALTQYNSFNSWGWLENTSCLDSIKVLQGDIRDSSYCHHITKDIDTIFHLAALIAIPYSYSAPESYIETNVKGTLNICQAALTNNVGRVVHTSTSEVYGTAQYVPINEAHPLQPQSPYSASKIGADAIAMSFHMSYKLPLTIARPFNTYGPRQSARAVIPAIIIQILNGTKTIKVGRVSPTRDFNYVADTCHGLITLANAADSVGEIFNIGSNFEISIEDTLNIIKELTQSNVDFITDETRLRPETSEVFRLWCDNTKIREATGYQPEFDIYDGLKKTIDWFSESDNLSFYKSDIYNV